MRAVCGICGATLDSDGGLAATMNAGLVHRGPDDDGVYVDPLSGLSLGARRLSIIDLAGGHQPLSNEDGTVWAVLNGEIYNHPELFGMLEGRGHRFGSRTDTEVLVHLYEELGPGLVHALEGMYAFAVWDTREERLIVGRDRMGEKPLFYWSDGQQLRFASELGALARVIPRPELRSSAVDEYFVLGYVSSPRSFLEGVEQLPPAHVLEWRAASPGVNCRSYWSPPAVTEPPDADASSLAEEVQSLLERSVRSRLIADVPLGVFLSGGLDSTLIAAIASQIGVANLKTFSVGYDAGNVSELDPARRTATALGTDHAELVLSEGDVAESLPRLLGRLDQPLADPALAPLHAVSVLARQQVTVAVGGEGADELFGGYPRYRWLERAERIDKVVPASVARSVSATIALAGRPQSRARRLAEVISPRDPLERHLDWVTEGRRATRGAVYGPALADRTSGTTALESLAYRVKRTDAKGAIDRFMRLDVEHWLPDDVLAKADRAGMIASLEIRTPFLQRELVELALTIPSAVHLRQNGKFLLRSVLKTVAPDASWARPKTAFRVPIAEWLRGRLGELLTDQTDGGRAFDDGWFDAAAVRATLARHRSGQDMTHVLWPIFVFSVWSENGALGRR